jgi:hypothetical protein
LVATQISEVIAAEVAEEVAVAAEVADEVRIAGNVAEEDVAGRSAYDLNMIRNLSR